MSLIALFVLQGLALSPCHAGKRKSGKSYMEQLDATIVPMELTLDRLKVIIDSNNNTGSFLTKDFWGLKPSWYLNTGDQVTLTNQYVFADQIIRNWGVWKKFPEQANRNIKGVIFNPVKSNDISKLKGQSFSAMFRIELDTSPGFDPLFGDMSRFVARIKTEFGDAGIPENKINVALDFLDSKFAVCFSEIEKRVLTRYDKLFVGNSKNGDLKQYEEILKHIDKYYARQQELPPGVTHEQITVPAEHPKLFNVENFADAHNSPLNVKSLKDYSEAKGNRRNKKQKSLLEFYLSKTQYLRLDIRAVSQHFKVAKGKSKSVRYNQLKKLEQILEEMVATGRAEKTPKSGRYFIYRDVTGNGLYKGELGIDFNSGEGYWQMPIVGAGVELSQLQNNLKAQGKDLNTFLAEYYSLCKKETISKFRQTSNTSNSAVGVTSDF